MSVVELGRRLARRGMAIRSQWASRYLISLGQASPDLIFVAGTGRSGTTWLAELLARSSRRRLVFEPFRNDRVPLWEHAAARQYIRPDDGESVFLEPARRILRRDFRNEWADYYNERIVTRGRIVKDIRANLMLRWLYEQFGPFPLIYLIRHPAAVAASWEREGWSVSLVDELLAQAQLVDDFLAPFAKSIIGAGDPWDQIVYLWCIENSIPLQQFSNGEALIVFYESLIIQPEVEAQRIAEYCGIQLTVGADWLSRLSPTTNRSVAYTSQVEQLLAGRSALTAREAERIASLTAQFGLHELYGDDGLPHRPLAPTADLRGSAVGSRGMDGKGTDAMHAVE